jgi:dihydropteroate synthase
MIATQSIDDVLSQRPLELDPAGYFIIYLDPTEQLICAKHYGTIIDDRGVALDPNTGLPLPAQTAVKRQDWTLFTGRTAKELCVKLFEETTPSPVSQFSHAAYLGREFVRAEQALLAGTEYVQD